MSFRVRLIVVFFVAALVPIISFALFVRGEMSARLTKQYERRVDDLIDVLEGDLTEQGKRLASVLSALKEEAKDNNRFRRAAVDRSADDRHYLLDYAGEAMRLTGISMLQIQDGSGRIVSSGHFSKEYGRLEPELPRLLAAAPDGIALVRARAPGGPFVALARIDSFEMGGRPFYFVAGVRVEGRFLRELVRDADLRVSLEGPDGGLLTPAGPADTTGPENRGDEGEIVRVLDVPFIDGTREGLGSASIRVVHPLTGLRELQGSVNRWFLVAVAATCVLAVFLSTWLASRISRPLVALADKTSRLDLERLDVRFATGRNDEIGALSRMLDAMTGRLRASALHVKDAERRATLGELARQVNHDIKNGLTPIRNVFRHLAELGRDRPGDMPGVFEERKQTLDSSISYLEDLATNYARLGRKSERRRCDVNQIVRRVAADLQSADGSYEIRTALDGGAVNGDPVALRRVLENLVGNAIDSLDSRPGRVTVTTADSGGDRVRIEVTDTGRGMTGEQQSRVFDDFYTTKETGTGLGLSIVRRLVMDLDGSIRVDSAPGGGSRFIVEIPSTPGPE